jgi:hypothetical protein
LTVIAISWYVNNLFMKRVIIEDQYRQKKFFPQLKHKPAILNRTRINQAVLPPVYAHFMQ